MIRRINIPFALTLALILTMTLAWTATATPARECAKIDAYGVVFMDSLPDDPGYVDSIDAWLMGELDPDAMTRSELRTLSMALQAWAFNLADVPASQIPKVMEDFHDAWTRYIASFSTLIDTVLSGNLYGAEYAATVTMDAQDEVAKAMNAVETACGPIGETTIL